MSTFQNSDDREPANGGDVPMPGRRTRFPEAVSAPRQIAALGDTLTITGDVCGDENLVIGGTVRGSVNLNDSDLTIGESGRVMGAVTAGVVRIEGEVTGDVTGRQKVAVTRTGRVRGDIVAPRVVLDDGCRFVGRIDMDSREPRHPGERP